MKTFEAGKTYETPSVCDHECIFSFKVIRRTSKSVWITGESVHNERKKIDVWGDEEQIFPLCFGDSFSCFSFRDLPAGYAPGGGLSDIKLRRWLQLQGPLSICQGGIMDTTQAALIVNDLEVADPLPICCHCFKIRNKAGEYIDCALTKEDSEHWPGFSHGVCPSCKREFYSEYL